PRAVRPRGHAGVPGPRARPPAVEGRRARRPRAARAPGHLGPPDLRPPERGHRPAHPGRAEAQDGREGSRAGRGRRGPAGRPRAMSHAHAPAAAAPPAEPFTKSLERMNYFQEPEARALIADLALTPGSRGLDVGCGVGVYALWLAEAIGLRGRVTGIEPTAERVQAAHDLVGRRLDTGRLEFHVGDGTALSMDDASVDWVWCGDVLHHIQDTGAALSEFRRVVRPGGRVVIKESQVLSAMFLPGTPELERRIQL